jgi:polysaccharide pyruvyl transferase WcaK-like protein
MGKPSLAYAVDAGSLSRANQRLVRGIASRTSLIVARSAAAAERLRDMGVKAPMASTADNAFTFVPSDGDLDWPRRAWPESRSGMVGIAPVDFSLWPAVMRPWGRRERRYKWPYYFSTSRARSLFGEELGRGYARLADHVAETSDKVVALICMEEVDEELAGRVLAQSRHPERIRLFSSRHHDSSQLTVLLRSLDLLVTSRFHASVLSLAAAVPQVAVGHDSRLATLYADLELGDRWFLDSGFREALTRRVPAPGFFLELKERVDRLLAEPEFQTEALRRGFAAHLGRARRNRQLLADFVANKLPARGSAAPKEGGSEWVA